MILFDVNVLLHALRADSARHRQATDLLQRSLQSGETVAWHPLLGAAVIRIATNARVHVNPNSLDECLSFIDALTSCDAVTTILESDTFWRDFAAILTTHGIKGPQVSDAYLAALAIENDATIISSDRDFRNYEGLKYQAF